MTLHESIKRSLDRAKEASRKADRRPAHVSNIEHQQIQIQIAQAVAALRKADEALEIASGRA